MLGDLATGACSNFFVSRPTGRWDLRSRTRSFKITPFNFAIFWEISLFRKVGYGCCFFTETYFIYNITKPLIIFFCKNYHPINTYDTKYTFLLKCQFPWKVLHCDIKHNLLCVTKHLCIYLIIAVKWSNILNFKKNDTF